MSNPGESLTLYQGAALSGLDYEQIWERQATFGGSAAPIEVEAYILGLLRPDRHQHNLIAQAINEYFIDRGQNHPVAYFDSSEVSEPDLS